MKPFAWIAVLILLLAAEPSAHALRCGNLLVHEGDYEVQVRDRCGDPYWIEDHYQFVVSGPETLQSVQQVVYTAWFYNFGSNRLLVRILFRDGHLVREDTLGRGVQEIGDSCGPAKFDRGTSSGELVAYCGEPVSREALPDTVVRRLGPGVYSERDDYREDWIYDLGDNFLYVAHLRNGHVDSTEHIAR
jgi:hypothetical protein